MSWCYRHFVRPFLFTQDSERIHNFTLRNLSWASRHPKVSGALANLYSTPDLPVEAFGLKFPNPVGLAAGMDKNAAAVPIWKSLGFGFAELGGVTWHAQPGNPKPRIFRAIHDEAIVNRMGFNNGGAQAMALKLADWKARGLWPSHPVGINLGKSKTTPLEKAADDYADSFRVLRDYADFFVVNVSSPNTPNLRQLQDKAALDEIFRALQQLNNGRKPILVKVAPDLSLEALDEILELVTPRQIAGIVATNTTITRPSPSEAYLQKTYSETGGLSGRPLRYLSTQIIRHLYKQTKGKLPIIGVGGIFNADDALAKIFAGASLVQVYTGLVYEGPAVARDIMRGLHKGLAQHGFKTIAEAVGSGVR
ncbi:MAG: hypothetical protein JWM68_5824 [Verrucomicrobiales bacterium]|nr:hypothetical protein [Verrucomicrobiales bacterium]